MRFVIAGKLEGIGWFSWETASRMIRQHPEHEFVLFFDRRPDPQFTDFPNVEVRILMPPARRPFLWKLWFDWAVPRALRRSRADYFLSLDGFCSLRTETPQYMVIHDLGFEHFDGHVPASVEHYYRHYTPLYAHKALRLAAVSEATREDIISTYGVEASKIDVVYNGAGNRFAPLSSEKVQEVRNRLSDGRPYFIYVGSMHPRKNTIRLLEAYDEYLNRQPEGLDLVIAGRLAWNSGAIADVLQKMKHADRVRRIGHLGAQELADSVGAARAVVYPSLFEGFGIPVLEGMQSGVPVITSNLSSMPEVAGDAALLIDPYNTQDIADAMQKINADARVHADLVERGLQRATHFSWDRSAEKLWESFETMVRGLYL